MNFLKQRREAKAEDKNDGRTLGAGLMADGPSQGYSSCPSSPVQSRTPSKSSIGDAVSGPLEVTSQDRRTSAPHAEIARSVPCSPAGVREPSKEMLSRKRSVSAVLHSSHPLNDSIKGIVGDINRLCIMFTSQVTFRENLVQELGLKATNYNPLSHEAKKWFYGSLKRQDADHLLQGQPEGTFLVRTSTSPRSAFAISVVNHQGSVRHLLIGVNSYSYSFVAQAQSNQRFENLCELVSWYKRSKRIRVMGEDGTLELDTKLQHGLPRIGHPVSNNQTEEIDDLKMELIRLTEMLDDNQKVEQEYASIPLFRFSYKEATQYTDRNRYKDILPYDYNRVDVGRIESTTDPCPYFNASTIRVDTMGDCDRIYIACQGPKKTDLEAFWKMVWIYEIPMILMLTKTIEGGKEKSCTYWPEEQDDVLHVGPMKIRCLEVHKDAVKTMTLLEVAHGADSRVVVHIQNDHWADKSIPTDTLRFHSFIFQMRQLYQALVPRESTKPQPIVVHCSAGVGRSGTYIAIDALMDCIERDGVPRIRDTVSTIRAQRMHMVQTPEQYRLVYHTTRHIIRAYLARHW